MRSEERLLKRGIDKLKLDKLIKGLCQLLDERDINDLQKNYTKLKRKRQDNNEISYISHNKYKSLNRDIDNI